MLCEPPDTRTFVCAVLFVCLRGWLVGWMMGMFHVMSQEQWGVATLFMREQHRGGCVE
jgi:hypothetical protein